jgi:hypothetical protein
MAGRPWRPRLTAREATRRAGLGDKPNRPHVDNVSPEDPMRCTATAPPALHLLPATERGISRCSYFEPLAFCNGPLNICLNEEWPGLLWASPATTESSPPSSNKPGLRSGISGLRQNPTQQPTRGVAFRHRRRWQRNRLAQAPVRTRALRPLRNSSSAT